MIVYIEKYRILISRIAAVFVLFLVVTTQSCWEKDNEMFGFILL